MKTNAMYLFTPDGRYGMPLYSRMVILAVLIALLFASFPAVNALAAPASGQPPISKNLDLAWKNKLQTLQNYGLFYDSILLYPSDFDKPSDLAKAHEYLEKYGVALRAANTIVFKHAGFDIKGNVLDDVQADQSVRDLAMYLQMMRGLREKIGEIPSRSKGI